MNGHPSALVFALYLVGGGFVLALGRLVFLAYYDEPLVIEPILPDTVATSGSGQERLDTTVSHYALARATQRLEELQLTVERTQELLRRRTDELQKKSTEVDVLRKELDESVSLLFSVLTEDAASPTPTVAPERSAQIEGELNRLREQLEVSADMQSQQQNEVLALRTALAEAELEIANLQIASTEELTIMASEQAALSEATRQIVARLGADAVPVLTPLLSDPEPAVRAWAASSLGRVGFDALSVVPNLTNLLQDNSAQVRLAARVALDQIAP